MPSLTIPTTALFLMGWIAPFAVAAKVVVFGPNKYVRLPGPPNQFHGTFFAPGNPEPGWFLEVWNGDAEGNKRISAAIIFVNGISVLPKDFNQNMPYVREDVTDLIHASNAIDVELRGSAGGYLTVQVTSGCSNLVLMAQKDPSGNDVELSWTGGCCVGGGCTVEYDLYSSTSPKMTTTPFHLLGDPVPSPLLNYTDIGAAADSSRPLICYVVSDQTKPAVAITSPTDGFTTTSPTIGVTGTYAGAFRIFVNEQLATLGSGTFDIVDPPGLPLAIGTNLITAAAKQAEVPFSNVTQQQGPTGTRSNGNTPPTFEFLAGSTVLLQPSGTTVYTGTPNLKVRFCDTNLPSPPPALRYRIDVDARDRTTFFTQTAGSCSGGGGLEYEYQIATPEELANGAHSITAAVRDASEYYANGYVSFEVSNPVITSLNPSSAGVGQPVTIVGWGFDPAGTNTVSFGEVQVPLGDVTVVSDTQIDVLVPAGATGGPVVVDVNGRVTNEAVFQVLVVTGFSSTNPLTSLAINPVMADATRTGILFANRGPADDVWQVNKDGSFEGKLVATNDPVGLPVDSAGGTYYGSAFTGTNNGRIDELLPPPPGSSGNLLLNTRLPGESNSRIYGCGVASPQGAGPRLFLLDGANGKIKRVDDDGLGGFTVVNVKSGLTFVQGNSIVKSQDGSTLYFTDINSLKSMPIAGGATTTIWSSGGPTGMANALTPDVDGQGGGQGWLLLAHRGLAGGRRATVINPTNCSPASCEIYVLATPGQRLYDAEWGTDSKGAYVLVAEQTKAYRIDKPSILVRTWDGVQSEGLPRQVYADFDPTANSGAGGDAPLEQFLILEAYFSPTALVPDGASSPFGKVEWVVEDPDDPSTDCVIDQNDWNKPTNICDGTATFVGQAPDDNADVVDPATGYASNNAPLWQEYTYSNPPNPDITYTMDEGASSNVGTVHTKVVGNISRVRLNLPGRPGDNVRIIARAKIPIYGEIQTVTPIVTVWKKLWVELDSMGPCVGPFQEEDLPCDEIPDPDLTFLSNAFSAAYVSIFQDPTQNQGMWPFVYNVGYDYAGEFTLGAMARQGGSSQGRWEVQLQGGYEGDSKKGGDPDTANEPHLNGHGTPSGQPLYSWHYLETIRDFAAIPPATDEFFLRRWVSLHEIGHYFRFDEEAGGVMNTVLEFAPPLFSNCEVNVIRRCIDNPEGLPLIPGGISGTCAIPCPP